jgi:pectin methylesterase-like acyl-CoA thioesterase
VFASSATDMVVDVVGYFTPPSGGYVLSVAPSGAQYTSIQAAIDAAAAVATASQRYLVKVAPGIYNEQITLKDFVDVEGSGRRTTQIQWSAGKPTVTAGANAELRELRILNTTSGAFPTNGALAVLQSAQSPTGNTRLVDLFISALGSGDNAGVIIDGGVLVIADVALIAGVESPLGSGGALGVSSDNASIVRLRNSQVFTYTSNAGFNAALERNASSLLLVNDTLVSGPIVGTPTCISVFSNLLQARTC